MEWDRQEMLDYGRSRGFYTLTSRSLLVEGPACPFVRMGGRKVPVSRLDAAERRRLLVATSGGGWEPAMVWLNQWGLPMSVSGWKHVVTDANAREALTAQLTALDVALADSERLAPYVRHRLEVEREEAAGFLARHRPETP